MKEQIINAENQPKATAMSLTLAKKMVHPAPKKMSYIIRYNSGNCRAYTVDYDAAKFEKLMTRVDKSNFKDATFYFGEIKVSVQCKEGKWTVTGPNIPEGGYTYKYFYPTVFYIKTYVSMGDYLLLKKEYEKENGIEVVEQEDAGSVIKSYDKYETGNAEAFLNAYNKDNNKNYTPYQLARKLDTHLNDAFDSLEWENCEENKHARRLLMDLFKEYRDDIIPKMFEYDEINIDDLGYDPDANCFCGTLGYNWEFINYGYTHDDGIEDAFLKDMRLLFLCDIADILGFYDMYQELTDTNHPNYKKLDYMIEVA